MSEINKGVSNFSDKIDYQRDLLKLIDFIEKNPESGRFVQDLLSQVSIFKERIQEFRKKLSRNEPLLDRLLELILHNFILRDSRVSAYFEIPINEARRAMETLVNQMSDFFRLRKDDRDGWDMIIKKEATIIGIK